MVILILLAFVICVPLFLQFSYWIIFFLLNKAFVCFIILWANQLFFSLFFFPLLGWVLLCILDWLRTHFVYQSYWPWIHRAACLCPSTAGIKGLYHHIQLLSLSLSILLLISALILIISFQLLLLDLTFSDSFPQGLRVHH